MKNLNEELNRIKSLMLLNELTVSNSDVAGVKSNLEKSKEHLRNIGITASGKDEHIIPTRQLKDNNFELSFNVKEAVVYEDKNGVRKEIYKPGESVHENRTGWASIPNLNKKGFYYEHGAGTFIYIALRDSALMKIAKEKGIRTNNGIYDVDFYWSQDNGKTINQLEVGQAATAGSPKENIGFNRIKITGLVYDKLHWKGSSTSKIINFKSFNLNTSTPTKFKMVVKFIPNGITNTKIIKEISTALNNGKPIDAEVMNSGDNNRVGIDIGNKLSLKLNSTVNDHIVLGTTLDGVDIWYDGVDYPDQKLMISKFIPA